MFERYTERARRVIFFARYEASQFGSRAIEPEHVLLGLIREDKNLTNRFLRDSSSIESIRAEIESRTTIREKVSTSIELPVSDEVKRILSYAAEESERLGHRHIGTEHILLGILREENGLAAEILRGLGLRLSAVREQLAHSAPDISSRMDTIPTDAMVPDANTAKLIATAIWKPVYGQESIPALDLLQAELKFGVWRVTGHPLFAAIHSRDGKVVALGWTAEGADV